MYAIVKTYYKYGDYELIIIDSDDKLENFLLDECTIEVDSDTDLETLKDIVINHGTYNIENQIGWGVREITKIE